MGRPSVPDDFYDGPRVLTEREAGRRDRDRRVEGNPEWAADPHRPHTWISQRPAAGRDVDGARRSLWSEQDLGRRGRLRDQLRAAAHGKDSDRRTTTTSVRQ